MSRYIAGVLLLLAALLAVPSMAAAAGPVGVGHSGWFWGNPQPQGYDLSATAFSGTRGYAVGRDGAVLRSDDGGSSWTGLGSGTRENLTLVQALGPNTVLIGGGCSVRRSDDAGATFRRLPFTPSDSACASPVAAVSFSSAQVGYVLLRNGTVLRTADGGRTFGQRTSVPDAGTDIDFVSDEVGTAVGGGRIYRTVNGGNSWTAVTGGNVGTVLFIDPATAVAVGANGTFLTSTDGAATFTAKPLAGAGAGKNFGGAACVDAATCLLTNGTGQIIRTSDGGATSSLITGADAPIAAAAALPSGRVIGVGGGGATVVSDDGGATFSPVGSRLANTYGTLRSAGGSRAYALGPNGRYARTVDGGRSWAPFGVPTAGDIEDVSFPTVAVGYALDASGALLRTDNGGDSWRILDPGAERARSIVAPDPRHLVVVGRRGVRRSLNGGDSFGASTSKALRGANLVGADQAGSAVLVWGARRVALSRNGGSSWTRVGIPKVRVGQVDFVDRRRGFLTDFDGRVYATTNGGRRWRQRTAVGWPAEEISFADARHGYVRSAATNDVLRTDDGGLTWEPQVIPVVPSAWWRPPPRWASRRATRASCSAPPPAATWPARRV